MSSVVKRNGIVLTLGVGQVHVSPLFQQEAALCRKRKEQQERKDHGIAIDNPSKDHLRARASCHLVVHMNYTTKLPVFIAPMIA